MVCEKKYYDNGNIKSEEYIRGEYLHRDNLPALIEYYNTKIGRDSKIKIEEYWKEENFTEIMDQRLFVIMRMER